MKAKEKLKEELDKKMLEVSAIVNKLDGDIDCLLLYKYRDRKEMVMLDIGDKKEIALMINMRDYKGMRNFFGYNVQALKEE